MTFCDCVEWKNLYESHREVFKYQPPYGWIIVWLEVTEEKGYNMLHRYGIKINFCPFCGKKLFEPVL